MAKKLSEDLQHKNIFLTQLFTTDWSSYLIYLTLSTAFFSERPLAVLLRLMEKKKAIYKGSFESCQKVC